jgi:hypothetical protein
MYTPADTLPGGVNSSAFDFSTGLGDLVVTHTSVGAEVFFVTLFVDHEIDESVNTFFNEFGDVSGTPGAGQRWEIDEPGFTFGDIYQNVLAGGQVLDQSNGVPSTSPDDVSMAMSWNFLLVAGQTATASFRLSTTMPSATFYLLQRDPDSDQSLFLSGSASIRPDGEPPIPEPGTVILLLSGLGVIAIAKFRKSA